MNQQHFNAVFNRLTQRRREVLLKLLANQKDEAIAKSLHIQKSTVRKYRQKICNLFGLKNEFPDERRSKLPELIALFAKYKPELLNLDCPDLTRPKNLSEEKTISENADFVGRNEAITHLNNLVNKGVKVICIYGQGGIGKTKLAYHYFETQKLEYLELQVGMEAQYITSVKSWIKDQLHYPQQELGQDLISILEQLKRQLQNKPVAILIDNVETALDESGKFKKDHIDYLQLIVRVLNDPSVKSITLITSREMINESKLSFIEAYTLKGLYVNAWEEYFKKFGIYTNPTALSAIHKAYGGNALCMKVLREAIQTKYNGDLEAYWQDNQEFLLKGKIKDLIASQFDRIRDNNIYVHQLICRLGLYSYQKIPHVPKIGILCLLWDVEEQEKLLIIEHLDQSHLLEFTKGKVENIPEFWEDIFGSYLSATPGWILNLQKLQNNVKLSVFQSAGYSLHPYIWEEAKSRLNLSKQSIDDLLLSLKKQIDRLLKSSEKLQNFLQCVYQKQQTLFCTFPYKTACIRSAYIELAIEIFGNLANEIDSRFEVKNAGTNHWMDMYLSIELDISFAIAHDINHIYIFLSCFDTKSIFWEGANTITLSDIDFVLEIYNGIKRVLTHQFERNPELHERLQDIQSLLPEDIENISCDCQRISFCLHLLSVSKPELNPSSREIPLVSLRQLKNTCGSQLRASIERFEQWFQINGQMWLDQLAEVISSIPRSNISDDWQFSQEERKKLMEYYDANRLLVDCLKKASEEVRSHIEDTLLLPIAEIEKRKFKE